MPSKLTPEEEEEFQRLLRDPDVNPETAERESVMDKVFPSDTRFETVGGTLGSILGPATKLGKRNPVGAAMSGLGSALGEGAEQIGQSIENSGIDIPGLDFEGEKAPRSFGEGIGRLGGAFARGFVGDTMSNAVLGKLAQGAKKTQVGKLTQGVLKGLGLKTPLANVAESRFIKAVSELSETGLTYNFVGRTRTKAIDSLSTELREMGEIIAKSTDENVLEGALTSAVKGKLDAYRIYRDGLWSRLKMFRKTMDITDIKIEAAKLARNLDPNMKGRFVPTVQTALKEILDRDSLIHIADAAKLQGDLASIAASSADLIKDKPAVFGAKMSALLEAKIDDTIKLMKNSDVAKKAFMDAREVSKLGHDVFNSGIMKGIVRANPDRIIPHIFKHNTPSEIKLLRDTLDDPKMWKEIENAFLARVIKVSSDKSKHVSRLDFGKGLNMMNQFGEKAMHEMFPKGEANKIRSLFEAGFNLARPREAGGSFRVFMAMKTAGAMSQLIGGLGSVSIGMASGGSTGLTGIGMSILLAPTAIGAALNSKPVLKLMLEGAKAGTSVQTATKFLSRLSLQLTKEGIEHRTISDEDAERFKGESFFSQRPDTAIQSLLNPSRSGGI